MRLSLSPSKDRSERRNGAWGVYTRVPAMDYGTNKSSGGCNTITGMVLEHCCNKRIMALVLLLLITGLVLTTVSRSEKPCCNNVMTNDTESRSWLGDTNTTLSGSPSSVQAEQQQPLPNMTSPTQYYVSRRKALSFFLSLTA